MLEKNDSGKFSKLENSVLGKGGNFYCCNKGGCLPWTSLWVTNYIFNCIIRYM